MANRNKRSLVLDLKHAALREFVDRLSVCADIVVEGSCPDVAERMGIGPERLRALHHRLVLCCSIFGSGQTGPWRLRSGHDVTYLAASGALADPRTAGDTRPRRSGLPGNDTFVAADGRWMALGVIESVCWDHFVSAAGDVKPRLRHPAYATRHTPRWRGGWPARLRFRRWWPTRCASVTRPPGWFCSSSTTCRTAP